MLYIVFLYTFPFPIWTDLTREFLHHTRHGHFVYTVIGVTFNVIVTIFNYSILTQTEWYDFFRQQCVNLWFAMWMCVCVVLGEWQAPKFEKCNGGMSWEYISIDMYYVQSTNELFQFQSTVQMLIPFVSIGLLMMMIMMLVNHVSEICMPIQLYINTHAYHNHMYIAVQSPL